ncbi:hypothetical protein [Celeribacter persicus]|uniref:Uncharacterized protein n=1 Tax=Celeribacter persicus TaxID=1651082 RepID=A0A2T5HS40_9RHOB|nr:hypothetical protein [Celeribacter persicus]PTQ74392.1 hypothetical protein C8N42_10436 [Celeribacter persicus]
MSSDDRRSEQENERGGDGRVLLRARNGDVIRFDETGLILKLSDQVVADLRQRLFAPMDAEMLGDLDAWNLRAMGDWIFFDANLPGMAGPRGYRRAVTGGAILAETPGPVLGVLSLGGARRTRAIPGQGDYPYHVVAPEDDIGAVGMAGIEDAPETARAEGLREQTQDALLAEEMLRLRQKAGRGLPLMLTRCETDRAASLADLAAGKAFGNLMRAAANLKALAATLDKPAKLAALSVDFVLEDILTLEAEFASAMRGLLETLARAFWKIDLRPVPVLMVFDTTASVPGRDRRQAQWELAVYGGEMGPVFTLPSYAMKMNATLRPTDEAMRQRARTEAAALMEMEAGRNWHCPRLLLAEWEGERMIRLRSDAAEPLVIDADDPFGAGVDHGLRIEGPEGAVETASVTVDPEEPRDILIELTQEAPRKGLMLSYAWDGPGALRDTWTSVLAPDVKRWALPARLEVHG